jgi:3-hydroxyacyl-[acyl-carrier-protein] dehydratase
MTTLPLPPGDAQPSNEELTLAKLRETLKRCSPETIEAACRFHLTRDRRCLTPLVAGVIERYVERELRPRLRTGDLTLRLVEDLALDSLTLMEIVVLTEDVLQISVSNEELVQLRTIADIRDFIAAKVP